MFLLQVPRMLRVRVDNLSALGLRARSGQKKDVKANER